MPTPDNHAFVPIGCWAPKGGLYTALRPRLWPALRHAPVSICIESSDTEPRHATLAWWSYSRGSRDGRLCIRFASRYGFLVHAPRWRTISNALWRMIAKRPTLTFSDIPVDISDCTDSTVPRDTLRFAKLPGDPHDLIPNAHLLGPRKPLPRAIPWNAKRDTLYFRGSLTGGESWDNPRVSVCVIARDVPRADCKLTYFPPAITRGFVDRVTAAGIVAPHDRPHELNHHRYLLDVDGNTSSWDRFRLIGLFGSVPIRFETKWEEFWHPRATPGEHYATADRHTLGDVVENLRARPSLAHAIRTAAADLAVSVLSPDAIQSTLEEVWLRRA